ncbi:MAG: UDP-N-acetylmuramoyl-L-alanine--D-glutamate ligase [Phycisphaerae bacterium]
MNAKTDPALAGKRVTVIGLGRFGGGLGVTRWLCSRGARVTVTDRAPADKLADSVAALAGLDVALHLGGHDERDFVDTDLLVVNPAVDKAGHPQLQAAIRAGVRLTTEMNLFLERCPARIVGITGTVGKSTTTAMAGEILRRKFTTHVGGNIGRSLLEELDTIGRGDVVVLELSSFQLEDVAWVGISPHVAVVTNLAPNHIDRHGTLDAYAAAKKNIFRFQRPEDVLVLNSACELTRPWAKEARGRVEFFDGSLRGDETGATIADCGLRIADPQRMGDGQQPRQSAIRNPKSEMPFELAVPGPHNQANAQAAWTAARQLGVDRPTAAGALKGFPGLPHRLAFVCQREGVRYFNDSKCTTPDGAIVAINSFPPRKAIIIAGGSDKHVSFDTLGAVLADKAKAVVAVGQTREQIIAAVEGHRAGPAPVVVRAGDFPSAVAAARGLAAPDDVVLLSPACASYDMFINYEKRGEMFVALVK